MKTYILAQMQLIGSLENEFMIYNDEFAAINYLDKCLEYHLEMKGRLFNNVK